MNRKQLSQALLVALIGSVALIGCKKKEEAAPAPAPTPVEIAPTPAPAPAPTVSVATVDLGTAVGPDLKVATPAMSFKPKDTIYASISTTTSDPAASVAGNLGVKWTYAHETETMTVNEESKAISFTGNGTNEFHIAKPSGFPVGKYKVEVSLDGAVVQSKDFEVTK
jgi:hypothetical protein